MGKQNTPQHKFLELVFYFYDIFLSANRKADKAYDLFLTI